MALVSVTTRVAPRGELLLEAVGVGGVGGGEEDGLAGIEQTHGGQVDQALPVACDEHRRRVGDGADDGERVVDREQGDGRSGGLVRRLGERLLVEQRLRRLGVVAPRCAERLGRAQPRRGGEAVPHDVRPGRVEALVLEVVAQHDVAHPEQPGDGGEGGGLGDALLVAAIEGEQQRGRRRLAVGDELASEVGAVDDAGGQRVDDVAPPVGGEVAAGDLEHTGAVVARVDGRGRLKPVVRAAPRHG